MSERENIAPNCLHKNLPPDLREKVETDLCLRPPERYTVEAVWQHYQLGELYGIPLKTLQNVATNLRGDYERQRLQGLGQIAKLLTPDLELSEATLRKLESDVFEAALDNQANPKRVAMLAATFRDFANAVVKLRKDARDRDERVKAAVEADAIDPAERIRRIKEIYALQ